MIPSWGQILSQFFQQVLSITRCWTHSEEWDIPSPSLCTMEAILGKILEVTSRKSVSLCTLETGDNMYSKMSKWNPKDVKYLYKRQPTKTNSLSFQISMPSCIELLNFTVRLLVCGNWRGWLRFLSSVKTNPLLSLIFLKTFSREV